MRSLFVALAMLGGFATAALAADPVGSYKIEGSNPSGGSYQGTAEVTKTGQTYQVVWDIGGTKYQGTAIGDQNFMAITYRAGDNTGLALYGEDGGNWKGVWTYAGGTSMGSEVWKRQ
jgi:hypothetical protein